jgi:protein-S-isoprenylcysteine O-methyltransferase Ste14
MALQEELDKQGLFLFKYKDVLPLIILSIGIFVFIQTKIDSTIYAETFFLGIFDFICLFVCLIGLGIRIYTIGYTPKNISGIKIENQSPIELNSSGIYSLVRHPLYIGNFFISLGIAMLTLNFWFVISFIFLYWIYCERIMYAKEKSLTKNLGEIYLIWSHKTPAIIPSLKTWVKPKIPFNWKKVLKNEKIRLPVIFVLFYFFALIDNYIENQNLLILHWTFFALIFSLIFYVSIILISKKTKLLSEAEV